MVNRPGSREGRQREKRYTNVRLTVSLRPVIFPLDFAALAQVLKNKQYELTAELPPPGLGRRVGGAGTIAKKGEVSVIADSDRRFIGIDGMSAKEVLSSFEQLTQILGDELWVDVRAEARYYEVVIRMHVLASGNPTAAIGRFFQNFEGLGDLESIMQESASLFTIRLVPKGKLPSGEEWFDIRLEPDVARPESAYAVEVVYRKSDYKNVTSFFGTIEQKIDSILDKLE